MTQYSKASIIISLVLLFFINFLIIVLDSPNSFFFRALNLENDLGPAIFTTIILLPILSILHIFWLVKFIKHKHWFGILLVVGIGLIHLYWYWLKYEIGF